MHASKSTETCPLPWPTADYHELVPTSGEGLTQQELCDACVSLLLRSDDNNFSCRGGLSGGDGGRGGVRVGEARSSWQNEGHGGDRGLGGALSCRAGVAEAPPAASGVNGITNGIRRVDGGRAQNVRLSMTVALSPERTGAAGEGGHFRQERRASLHDVAVV